MLVAVAARHLVAALVLDGGHATHGAALADLSNQPQVHGLVLKVQVTQAILRGGATPTTTQHTHTLQAHKHKDNKGDLFEQQYLIFSKDACHMC